MDNEGSRLLYNSLCLMCFTVLAVAFGKWWLIFLSAIFMSFKRERYD